MYTEKKRKAHISLNIISPIETMIYSSHDLHVLGIISLFLSEFILALEPINFVVKFQWTTRLLKIFTSNYRFT